jgi:hypothetical protein
MSPRRKRDNDVDERDPNKGLLDKQVLRKKKEYSKKRGKESN